MPVIQFTADMLLAAFQRLLPRGKIWPRDADAVQTQALATLMPTYQRLADRDNNLLIDALPTTTFELLPEWEWTLGLPDPCAGESPSISVRQSQVTARFEAVGGQSIPYLIQFAATLGYTITITEFAANTFHWQINAPQIVSRPFIFGSDVFGEQFVIPEQSVLECEMRRLAPAHTVLTFQYS